MNIGGAQFIATTLIAILLLRFILSSFDARHSFGRRPVLYSILSLAVAWGMAYVIEGTMQITKDLTFIYGLAIAGGEAILAHLLMERGNIKQSLAEKKRLLRKPQTDDSYSSAQEKLFASALIDQERFGERGPEITSD